MCRRGPRLDQHRIRAGELFRNLRERALIFGREVQNLQKAKTLETPEALAQLRGQIMILADVQLYPCQARLHHNFADFSKAGIYEHTDALDFRRQSRGDPTGLYGRHLPGSGCENEAERIGTRLHRYFGILKVRGAANLHPHRRHPSRTGSSNPAKASPGSGARISHSPIRNA